MIRYIISMLAMMLVVSTAKAQWVDDLYAPPTKKTTVVRSTVGGGVVQPATTTQRETAYDGSYDSRAVEQKELITSYEEALARRMAAMRSATYEQPESYWKLMEQYQAMLERKYNQKLYNIVVVGDEMWVEPKSITALFDDSDPAQGLIEYNDEVRVRLRNGGQPVAAQKSEVTINVVVDPFFSWNSWSYPYYRSWNSYYWDRPHYGRPYYDSYWHGYYPSYWPSYRPYWGGGYYHNHNPRGTYYGNSTHNRPGQYYPGWSNGGGSSSRPSGRPNVSGNNGGMGGGRPNVGRPNGNNTIDGLGGRPSVSSRPNSSRPNYERPGSTSRPTYERPGSTSRPTYERPGSTSRPNYERPATTTRPSVERPGSTSRPSVQRPATTSRPTYERPATTTRPSVQRPTTTSRPTYERPTTTSRPTYERPASTSRPSGGSVGGGGSSRPTGGSVGGGGRSR